jgi:hypothetical protein
MRVLELADRYEEQVQRHGAGETRSHRFARAVEFRLNFFRACAVGPVSDGLPD